MKLTKILVAAAIAASTSSAFALTAEDDLTTRYDIVVKDSSGNCVKVLGNIQSPECGYQQPVEVVQQVEEITLSADAFFAFDKSDLKPQGKDAIRQLANDLNSRGANLQKITVAGNTDSVGTRQYNQGLSERRAASVANFLIENGVPPQLIEAYGNGEDKPIATNDTAAGRAKNRRVDIRIQGTVERQVTETVITN